MPPGSIEINNLTPRFLRAAKIHIVVLNPLFLPHLKNYKNQSHGSIW